MSTQAAAIPATRNYARKMMIVNWRFQLRVLIPVVAFAVVYAVLLLVVLFLPLNRSVAAEPDLGIRAILGAQLWELHFNLWTLMVVALLLAVYYAWRWSFRIAGPLHRLHRTLTDMAEGEYKPMTFRDGDEFRFFEDDVAQLSQKMKLIGTRNRDILFGVHAYVKKLAERLAADEIIPRADLEEALQAIRAQLEKAPEISMTARR